MLKKVLFVFVCAAFLSGIACQTASAPSGNANKQNGNVNIDPKNLPEGLSTAPVAPSSNTTPGIPDPANVNKLTKGTTPIPGIPEGKELGKPLPKGATPTPGIPSEAEMKRQMSQPSNVNMQAAPSMRDTSPPNSGDSRSRKVGKKP